MSIRLFVAISLFFIIVFSYQLTNEAMPMIDSWLMPYVENIPSSSFLYTFFSTFTHFGSGSFLIPLTIIISIPTYVLLQSILPWIVISCGTLMTYVLNTGIKLLMQRERPQIVPELAAEGFSFPSGHAMISFVFYSLCMYFLYHHFSKKWIQILIVICGAGFIFLIGLSRYILYVHYVSDILAGYSMGFILFCMIIRLYETYTKAPS